MKNQTVCESTATSSQEQVIRSVLEGRTNGQIDDTADFADEFLFNGYGIGCEISHTQALPHPTASVSVQTHVLRANRQPWRRWLVVILAWVGIFAVVLLGLIFCSAAAVGLLVRHVQL